MAVAERVYSLRLTFSAELFAKSARNQRQLTAAAGYIKRFDIAVSGKQRSGFDRFGQQRSAALVEIGHRDHHLSHAFAHDVQVDHDAARVRVQRFFLAAAFLIEPENFGQLKLRKSFFADSHLGQDEIEIVAAEVRHSFRRQHGVRARGDFDEGNIAGASAQIVNQDAAGHFLAMAEFDGSGGGFVQQAKHGEAGAAKSVDGEESLIAVRVGGDAEHDFENFRFAEARHAAQFAAPR